MMMMMKIHQTPYVIWVKWVNMLSIHSHKSSIAIYGVRRCGIVYIALCWAKVCLQTHWHRHIVVWHFILPTFPSEISILHFSPFNIVCFIRCGTNGWNEVSCCIYCSSKLPLYKTMIVTESLTYADKVIYNEC